MTSIETLERSIQDQFNNRVALVPIRPNVLQIISPFHYRDGDMMEIYLLGGIEEDKKTINISDLGMVNMRLSYILDTSNDTLNKRIQAICRSGGISYSEGVLNMHAPLDSAYSYITGFAQVLSQIIGLAAIVTDQERSSFYEKVQDYVELHLERFSPAKDFVPLRGQDEYRIDYLFKTPRKPLSLFAIKDTAKAFDVHGTLLFLKLEKWQHQSLVVFENDELVSKKSRKQVSNIGDKIYTDEGDFYANGEDYIAEYLKTA